ncbi:hypothetical protein Enr13x_30040 [Stieleria neptunia]|uniref:Glycosyl transferase family 11 n=1 Tax=Stieleria neptunia TaxID=2527979 RepID=A0A518HQN2_9BACT|nr:hypothetical protein [Stieleria neptunia]QDV43150.1 hypothetical protein Enr13x_30040 [Stieleria neptunia]
MSQPLYYVHDVGGMCNRIFPFAHLIATSVVTDRPLANPTFTKYEHYFVGTNENQRDAFWENAGIRAPQLKLSNWRGRFKLARRLNASRVQVRSENELLDVEGLRTGGKLDEVRWISALYAIDNSAFAQQAALIKSCFRPVPEIERSANDCVDRLRRHCDVVIGVHIRQGDYAGHSGGMMFFETSEYRELMDQAVATWHDQSVGFLICSNVPQPDDSFDGLTWQMGPGSEIADLTALSMCDFLIGPPSTFSEWASYVGAVPRFVWNRKYEQMYQVLTKPLTKENFVVHGGRGFGKFSSRISNSLSER